jgi:hypothetical protein
MRDQTCIGEGASLLRCEPAVEGRAFLSHSADIGYCAMKLDEFDKARNRLAEPPRGTTGWEEDALPGRRRRLPPPALPAVCGLERLGPACGP